MYDPNHCFGLGPISKLKLADTVSDTETTFQRENLANIQDFQIIFEDLSLISSFQKPILKNQKKN